MSYLSNVFLSLSFSLSLSLPLTLSLHKAKPLCFSSFILIPQAGPCPHPLSCRSSDGIDRRVARLLIAAPNEWNRGKMEEGGIEGREANDSNSGGDVELINVCCLGSVTTLMLIEF